MTPDSLHEELRAALAAEALGALDGGERAALLAHLDQCPACRAELAELHAAAGVLAYASPAASMDAARSGRVRARLLARAAADRAPAVTIASGNGASDPALGASPSARADVWSAKAEDAREGDGIAVTPITAAPSRNRRGSALPWLAAAASLVLMLAAGAWALDLRARVDVLAGEVDGTRRERAELARVLQEREATLAAMSAPAVRVIDMASTGRAEPGGRMFWDRRTDRWTFFAHDLPAVAGGREYQLWLITPGNRKIPSGTFRPGARGDAHVEATFALPADSLQAVAVTEEPAGGLPQPSGPVVIAGAMSSR